MYAITAITGRVGGALAETLLTEGHQVRAIVRERAKGELWAARGCEVAIADAQDVASLTSALEGVKGAFVLLPPMFDPAPGFPEAKAMIAVIREALARALPQRLVVLSTIGANAAQPNLLNALRFLEEALADLPIPITFLRAAWFMENAQWDIPSARDEGVMPSCLQPLDRPFPMIATRDVGQTAARLLLEDWDGHRIVELEAQERVTPDQIARAFTAALGREVKAQAIPRVQWEKLFREQGMHNPLPRMQMLDGFNAGWIDFGEEGANKRWGRVGIDEAIATLCRG